MDPHWWESISQNPIDENPFSINGKSIISEIHYKRLQNRSSWIPIDGKSIPIDLHAILIENGWRSMESQPGHPVIFWSHQSEFLFPKFLYLCSEFFVFQLIVSTVGLFLNLYLVWGFVCFEDLRQMQFFLIMVQSCSDIVAVGLGSILMYILQVNDPNKWGVDSDYRNDVSENGKFLIKPTV